MPLVWAHSEFIKLAASMKLGRPYSRPEPVWLRYAGKRPEITHAHWTLRMPVGNVPRGRPIRFLFDQPTLVHWGRDDWQDISNAVTKPGALGLHVTEVAAARLSSANAIQFALQDVASGDWLEGNRNIRIV